MEGTTNKKKIFCVILDFHRINAFKDNILFHVENYKNLIPKDTEFYVVNVSGLEFFSNKIDIRNKLNNLNYFEPNSFIELFNFFKKRNAVGVVKILNNLKNLHLHIIFKILKIKYIIVGNIGYFPVDQQIIKKNLIQKLYSFINIKFQYYLFRIFSIIGIVSKVEYFFYSSKNFVDNFNRTFSKKVERLVPFLSFSLYKNLTRVNSLYYDNFLKDKNIQSKEFIVFCDSGFDHKDRINVEGKISDEDREKYYSKLIVFFSKLKKKYNKKIIYCLHPKVNYPYSENFNKIKKLVDIKKYETENYISRSCIVIFFSSLLVNYAIMHKKKIIVINSKYLGTFFTNRNKNYISKINLQEVNIDDIQNINFDEVDDSIEKKINKYDFYIHEHLISQKDLSSSEQIRNIINDKIFN